ncbi:hypothetical protein [Kineosporia babensis]|uniref:Anti-sigma-D factor RsdA sigma factor binding region domain-containing protein n=1 Tax=Kineosporia babensis TaxID=499548 RepID=A0A9X1NEG5_9ACTN|nr:hypothetical protein [Kineosporia babensis]MCD5313492.1 hypothetical protein [Kineosporia babensis]
MSTAPPPPEDDAKVDPADLPTADLSELAATDALLDRLAARSASEQDLLDPTTLALNSLLTEIDAESGADSATARLVEVLAGRPLYIDGPAVVEAEEELIDLTGQAPEAEATAETAEEKPKDEDDSAGGPPVGVEVTPITAARSKRWRTAAGKISAPVAAASIAVMVLLGGGVSAAVAGDPLAPLSGVGSVVAKLPGVKQADKNEDKLKEAQAELVLAQQLASSDPVQAAAHLAAAQQMLAELPDDDTADLDQRAEVLASQLAPIDPTDPSSIPGVTTVAATDTPAATPTDGSATTGPTTDPTTDGPTTAPPTSDGSGGGVTTPPTSSSDAPSDPPTTAPTAPTAPTTEPSSGSGGSGGGPSDPPAANTNDPTTDPAPATAPSGS